MTPDVAVTWISIAGSLFVGARVVVMPCYRGVKKVKSSLEKLDQVSAALGQNGGNSLADLIRSTHRLSLICDARLDFLTDLLDWPQFECAPNGENVRINAAFTKAFGWSPAEMQAHRWVRIIHSEDRDRYMTDWRFAVRDQRAFQTEARYLTKSGIVVHVRVSVEPNIDESAGTVIRWLGRVETITVDRSNGGEKS